MKHLGYLLALIALLQLQPTKPASALSAATARKCHALTLLQFPRAQGWAAYKPGDPAIARLREAYYRACLSKESEGGVIIPQHNS